METEPPKRNRPGGISKIERRKRLMKVRDLLLGGTSSERDIAARLGVCRQTAKHYVDWVWGRWLKSDPKKAKQLVALCQRRLEDNMRRALTAFELSQQNEVKTTTRVEKRKCSTCNGSAFGADGEWCRTCGGEGELEEEIVTSTVTGSPGNPAFLSEFRQCVIEYAKLSGLLRPADKGGKGGGVHLHGHVHADGKNNRYVGAPREKMIKALQVMEALRLSCGTKVIDAESTPAAETYGT